MPRSSKQTPLTSPRGRSDHDFSQKMIDWEAAVFDNAVYFTVVGQAEGRLGWQRDEFATFPEAADYATPRERTCLYAVSHNGRFVLIDREMWPEWRQRWDEALRLAA